MNNQEIIEARKEYKKRSNERSKKISKLIEKKLALKKTVLINSEYSSVKTKKEVLTETFREYGLKTKCSKKIYVFMGSYTPEDSPVGYRLSVLENPPWDYFNKYRDLETEEIIDINKKDVSGFEKHNIILKSKIPTSLTSPDAYLNSFQLFQQQYYRALNHTTQKQAIKYIKVRTKLSPRRKNEYRKTNNDAYRILLNYQK